MTQYLLKIDERTWRCIRAQMRWSYVRMTYKVPRRLIRFLPYLPEDAEEWREYATEVTALRRQLRREKVLKSLSVRQRQKNKRRAAYQRDYMREYRDRLRRGTV